MVPADEDRVIASTANTGTDGASPVARLVANLHAAGLRVGPSEAIDTEQVLRALAANVPAELQDRERLKRMLKPVLCKSVADAARFEKGFDKWFERESASSSSPPEDGSTTPKPGTSDPPKDPPGRTRMVLSPMDLIFVALPALAALFWLTRPEPPSPASPVEASAPAIAATVPQPSARASGAGAATAPALRLDAQPIAGYFPVFRLAETIRPAWWWALLGLLTMGCMPLLFSALPRLSRRRGSARARLQAWPAVKHLRQLVAELPPVDRWQLQRHVRGSAEERRDYARRPLLDVRRTVEATLSQLGVPKPRYHFARLRPSYLVLVQTTRDDDLGILWAERLRALDVRVAIFRFAPTTDGAPPHCVEIGGDGRRFAFDQLPSPTTQQRLVVLAPTGTLVGDDDTLRPWVRAAQLMQWRERALFTPDEPRDWNATHVGVLERPSNADPGMFVLPFDDNALTAWGAWLVHGNFPRYVLTRPQRYPRSLQENESAFVGEADTARLGDSAAEIAATVARLVDELLLYLGDNGFYWLCACAVPPLIDQRFALLLGEAYFVRCGVSEARLPYYFDRYWSRLIRLPWLRDEQAMPQWLRLALLVRLPRAVQEELRDVVRGVIRPPPKDSNEAAGMPLDFDVPDDEAGGSPVVDTGAQSLYVGFMRDDRDAEELVLRLSAEHARWLTKLVRRPSWRQRLGALRVGRLFISDSSTPWFRRLATAVVGGILAAGLVGLAGLLAASPDRARDWLIEQRSSQLGWRHGAGPVQVVFSPDDRRVLSWNAGSARLHDAKDGRPLGNALHFDSPPFNVAFSADGRRIAAAWPSRLVRSWDAATGARLDDFVVPGESLLGFDGSRAAVGSRANREIRVWDIEKRQVKGRVMEFPTRIGAAWFAHDVDRLMAFGLDDIDRYWDSSFGKVTSIDLKTGEITKIARELRLAPPAGAPRSDGQRLTWDDGRGSASKHEHDASRPTPARLLSLTSTPDDANFVATTTDNTVLRWALGNTDPVGKRLASEAPVTSTTATSDVRTIALGFEDGTVRLWSAVPPVPVTLVQGNGALVDARFGANGRFFVVFNTGHAPLEVRDTNTGQPLSTKWREEMPSSGTLSPDNRLIATATNDTIQLRSWTTARLVAEPLVPGPGVTANMAFSPDGRRLLTTSARGVQLWNVADLTDIEDGWWNLSKATDAFALTVDTSLAGPATQAATALARSRRELPRVPQGEFVDTALPSSVAFSPDGQRIVVAGNAMDKVKVFTAGSSQPPAVFEAKPSEAIFNPADQSVLLVSAGDDVRLWNPVDSSVRKLALGKDIVAVRFSPDGSRIATADADGLRIVDARTLELLAPPWPMRQSLVDVDWSPDGDRLLAVTLNIDSTPVRPEGDDSNALKVAVVRLTAPPPASSQPELRPAASLRDALAPWGHKTPVAAAASILLAMLAGLVASARAGRRVPAHAEVAAT